MKEITQTPHETRWLKPMTWKEFANTVRSITLEELKEKIEEERDLGCYTLAAPNTPPKVLGTAF